MPPHHYFASRLPVRYISRLRVLSSFAKFLRASAPRPAGGAALCLLRPLRSRVHGRLEMLARHLHTACDLPASARGAGSAGEASTRRVLYGREGARSEGDGRSFGCGKTRVRDCRGGVGGRRRGISDAGHLGYGAGSAPSTESVGMYSISYCRYGRPRSGAVIDTWHNRYGAAHGHGARAHRGSSSNTRSCGKEALQSLQKMG